MPELPEVEFARRCWEKWARGKTVLGVSAPASRVLRPSARALQSLEGAKFVSFQRRGKNLLLSAKRRGEPVGVWSHLGMTGKWVRRKQDAEPPRFVRARLELDDGRAIFYCDMRMFGRLQAIPGADFSQIPELRALGPDPLIDGIDVGRLFERLQKTRLPVKVALLDQTLLAGIGNIQASEALFRAAIDPRRPARSLSRPEVRKLAAGVTRSIAATLEQFEHAVSPDGDIAYVEEPGTPNPFSVYDQAGTRCPRCHKGIITRIVQAARSTFFCPHHQK
jgi:formamidopyrimidine-DNA glycosylase